MSKREQTKYTGIGYSLVLPILSSQNQQIVFDFVTDFEPTKRALHHLITKEHIYNFDKLNVIVLIALSTLNHIIFWHIAGILDDAYTYARNVCGIDSEDGLNAILAYIRDNTNKEAKYLEYLMTRINKLRKVAVKFPIFFVHNDQTILKHRIDIDLFYLAANDEELTTYASVINFSKQYLSHIRHILTKKGVHIASRELLRCGIADALVLQYLGKTVSSIDNTRVFIQPGLDGLLTGMKHWFSVFDIYDKVVSDIDQPSITFATIFTYSNIDKPSLKMYIPVPTSFAVTYTGTDLAPCYFSTKEYLESLLHEYIASLIYSRTYTGVYSSLVQYVRQFEMDEFFAVYEQMLKTYVKFITPVYSVLKFLAKYDRQSSDGDYGSLSDVEESEKIQAVIANTSKFQRPITHWRRTIEPFVSIPVKLKEYRRVVPKDTVLYELLGSLIDVVDQETKETVFAYIVAYDVMYYDISLHLSEYKPTAFKTITISIPVLSSLIDEYCMHTTKYTDTIRRRLLKLINSKFDTQKLMRLIPDIDELPLNIEVWFDTLPNNDPITLTGLLLAELMLTYMDFDSLSNQEQA